ncbi:hypothetical protein [Arachidicoccus soli]|uniref:Uncharacterized protein n=1 Tax=Arachidicoccus soli TaxID=2341117 RepID=A0A386HRX5_9BACT|nr:hypothetical protein [Arachidicoccus soli]AYD48220.1 hypothetical protein D6B99_11790 [Arachidicoccus soli]
MIKRFLITSKNFFGHVEVAYGINEMVSVIDFSDCSMLPNQRQPFKEAVPVLFSAFEDFVKQYNLTAVEAEYEVSFNDFWNGYGKKINKKRCEPIWKKMSKTEQVLCVTGLPAYHRYRQRLNKWQYDPDTYLKDKMWENEWNKLHS